MIVEPSTQLLRHPIWNANSSRILYKYIIDIKRITLASIKQTPPLRSAEDAMYLKLSMSITSIIGLTTQCLSYDHIISNELNVNAITIITWTILCSKGSNQLVLHSQWLSRNVSTSPVELSAPLILALTNPCVKDLVMWHHMMTAHLLSHCYVIL